MVASEAYTVPVRPFPAFSVGYMWQFLVSRQKIVVNTMRLY